ARRAAQTAAAACSIACVLTVLFRPPDRWAACGRTRDSRTRTIPSCDPAGRSRTAGAARTPDNWAGLRPTGARFWRARPGSGSLVAVRDAPAGQIVRGNRQGDTVAREDADPKAPHLAGDGREHVVAVHQQDAKRGVG